MQQLSTEPTRLTPSMAIAAFIDASRPQVAAIAASVLAKKQLTTAVLHLSATTAAVHEQLAILEAEYKLSTEMHAELVEALQALTTAQKDDGISDADQDALPISDLIAQRQAMLDSFTLHLSDLRQRQTLLAHGIEHGNVAMTDAFAKAAVAALPREVIETSERGTLFLLAYLVVAQLRDQLQAFGFRGLGEHAVMTLYVSALGRSAQQSVEHVLADPMANAVAIELAFKSAKEVHLALQAFHGLVTEKTSRTQMVRAQLANAMQSDLEGATPQGEPTLAEQELAEVMHRARQGSASRQSPGMPGIKGGRR